jgi:uncharacterized membrane protein
MNNESQLTEQESLELIARMINKAKSDFRETGIGALMWGTIITVCALVSFVNYYQHWRWAQYVWFLTFIAVLPQIIISVQANKRKKYTSYNEDAMGGIWISFGIGILLLSFFSSWSHLSHAYVLFLIFYGIPTFATGIARRFTPMISRRDCVLDICHHQHVHNISVRYAAYCGGCDHGLVHPRYHFEKKIFESKEE